MPGNVKVPPFIELASAAGSRNESLVWSLLIYCVTLFNPSKTKPMSLRRCLGVQLLWGSCAGISASQPGIIRWAKPGSTA
jgi:hypothetical protein